MIKDTNTIYYSCGCPFPYSGWGEMIQTCKEVIRVCNNRRKIQIPLIMMVQKWSVQGWVVNGRQAKMTPENHQKILVYLFECFTGKGKGQDQHL